MGKKKTKTSSTETSRTVTTPTRPDWVDDQAKGLNEALTEWGRRDPGASVAPLSDLERRASEGAAGLGVGGGWGSGGTDWANWGRPTPATGPAPVATAPELSGARLEGRGEVPQAASVLDNLSAYMTPFRDQVLALRPGLEAWARGAGCARITLDGRKGWARVLAPFGYRRAGHEIERRL